MDQAGNATNDGWAGEETLDVEWAHAHRARREHRRRRGPQSDGFQDMMAAVATARNLPGVSVVSMSWGMSEIRSETSYDGLFTTPAGHTGITFVAASGDAGSSSGAEWPSSSPNVVAVGGTSLFVAADGTYAGEAAWSLSGGGYSRIESEPSYQSGVQSSGVRTAPDVAFDANPSTGVSVYETTPSTGRGSWQVFGGTSLGSPAWAGIIAIVDQGSAAAGLGTLDGATQTLPALYALPASDFHKAGSLTTTGLGTPNGATFVDDLAFGVSNSTGSTTTTSSTASTVSTTSTTTTQTPSTPVTVKHPKRRPTRIARSRGRALLVPSAAPSRQALNALDAALGELAWGSWS